MTGCSDEVIVELVKNGDADAYGLLVHKYQDRIYSTIMNYVNSVEEATDLAQETFVKAYSALNRFHGTSAFYTWLYRIAVNTAIDHLRKRPAVRVDSLEDDRFKEVGFEPAADLSADPQHALTLKEEKLALRQAIVSLSEKLRTALILHDVEGLSQEEVATILNCPVGTVKSRVSRARYELRAILTEQLNRE
jgi:RNA polymerase sigma-70 factor (ECF subfamily)